MHVVLTNWSGNRTRVEREQKHFLGIQIKLFNASEPESDPGIPKSDSDLGVSKNVGGNIFNSVVHAMARFLHVQRYVLQLSYQYL